MTAGILLGMSAVELPLPIRRHLLTVEEYHRMGEAGVFAPEAHVELIEGEVIDMAPIGTRHASVVKRLSHALHAALAGRAIVSTQDPIRLGPRSEPEPDLALLRPRADFYRDAAPTAADTLLVIEVSDSTSAYDRQVKLPLYARHAIPEVWIVDLEAKLVRFHRRPHDGAYLETSTTATPGPTPVEALPDLSIDLADVLA